MADLQKITKTKNNQSLTCILLPAKKKKKRFKHTFFRIYSFHQHTALPLGNKEFLCITHTVEHNYISPSSTVGIQLHVSALYVGHLQVVI